MLEQRQDAITRAQAMVDELTAAVAAEVDAANREKTAKEIEARAERLPPPTLRSLPH